MWDAEIYFFCDMADFYGYIAGRLTSAKDQYRLVFVMGSQLLVGRAMNIVSTESNKSLVFLIQLVRKLMNPRSNNQLAGDISISLLILRDPTVAVPFYRPDSRI